MLDEIGMPKQIITSVIYNETCIKKVSLFFLNRIQPFLKNQYFSKQYRGFVPNTEKVYSHRFVTFFSSGIFFSI